MMVRIQEALTFDDVTLVPKYSKILPSEVDTSIKLTKNNLSRQDIAVIITDHDNFDYEKIKNFSKLIVDTRGVFRKLGRNMVRA